MDYFQLENKNKKISKKPIFNKQSVVRSNHLLKRFPKYLSNFYILGFEKEIWRILSKLKKTKIIRCMSGKLNTGRDPSIYLPFLIFQNKAKSLHWYQGIHPSILHYFSNFMKYQLSLKDNVSIKVFLKLFNIRSLEVSNFSDKPLEKPEQLLKLKIWQSRFDAHFKRMKNVKFLHVRYLNEIDENHYSFLRVLDSNCEMLSNLTELDFALGREDKEYVPKRDWNFPNLYKYITKFLLEDSSLIEHQVFLLHLGNFSNLSNLTLVMSSTTLEEYSILRSLEKLEKLKKISLYCSLFTRKATLSFFTNFSLPKVDSLEDFYLSISFPNWNFIFPNPENLSLKETNHFETNALCQNFYKQWEKVQKINTFSFIAEEFN